MSRLEKLGVAAVAVAATLVLQCGTATLAAGPGRNGGGVIYITYQGIPHTMQDDGSGLAPVPGAPGGAPSRLRHGGKRWFVEFSEVPGEFYPDFLPDGTLKDFTQRRVFVARSDAGDAVTLAISPDLDTLGVKWTVDDGQISWPGRRWDIDTESDTYGNVLEGGLYKTHVTFDGAGDITGGASVLVFPLPLVISDASRQSNELTLGPDMRQHDWAPDGTRFVFEAVSYRELRIGNVDTGELWVLYADPARSMGNPLWSPDGSRILFDYFTGWPQVTLINPDGSGLKKLAGSAPGYSRSAGVWSPTGSHVLYNHRDHYLKDSHIVRVKASGSGQTRLIGKNLGSGWNEPRVIAWR